MASLKLSPEERSVIRNKHSKISKQRIEEIEKNLSKSKKIYRHDNKKTKNEKFLEGLERIS